jgi:hypothetical protein
VLLPLLTHLELLSIEVMCDDANTTAAELDQQYHTALQPLKALTRLADLRLHVDAMVTASMLADMHQLTRLDVSAGEIEPGVLVGKTLLQHLVLPGVSGPVAKQVQLLSQLWHLQELTHLSIHDSFGVTEATTPPAALTANSKLQTLVLDCCTMPAGVWQHVLPAGRRLPYLQ